MKTIRVIGLYKAYIGINYKVNYRGYRDFRE